MQIGECASSRTAPRRGFTYLVLLFGLAAGGAALAALGTHWQVAAQREREAELLFRGLQWRDALQRFHDQTPAGQSPWPQTVAALLRDERHAPPRHHLRQAWADPFTGQADWVLLRGPDGGIVGLHSRSLQPLRRQADLPAGVSTPRLLAPNPQPTDPSSGLATGPALASDWHFAMQPGPAGTRISP